MNITIIGAGYVGLSTAACLAQLGHSVTCVDNVPSKIEGLREGQSPIFEPFLEQLLADNVDRMSYRTDYESVTESDVVFLAVGTPSLANGSPDLQYLRAAATQTGEKLGPHFTVIVNKSTVPVGSGHLVDAIVRDTAPHSQFCVASNPEFLREGSALHDSLYADRIVVGTDHSQGLEMLYRLYRPILDQSFAAPEYLPRPEELTAVPLVAADLTTAELIKYAANSFLATKISFINEVNRLAARVGADIQQVARGIGLDERIGARFLNPGIGWGGSCFGKDTSALLASAAEYGLSMPIVHAARETNYRQRELVVDQLMSALKVLKGRTVGILGVAFKPNTDDIRDAPFFDVARRLLERGARVRAHDPVALANARQHPDTEGVTWCDSIETTASGTDALILLTEWDEYRQVDWEALRNSVRNPLVLDARFSLDSEKLKAAGWQYLTVA
jgi:UDPglucose 6-dehydrogenase